ncbi:MAG: UDP-N-acetylmuramate dehydrogenase [Pyrinomonadaceae bacterium]|jgi:UDP-N-acetylmuramate dehydrogenase|nr:UDP-N-acetylmuramate dehydrogenase [Pyrinomonadaceae bacterium]
MDETTKHLNGNARDAALEQIATRLAIRAERGRRFAELTSLRVGGAIDWVVSPETETQAAALVYELDQARIGWRALGSGSNILADDGEHHYVVLSLKELKGELEFNGEFVSVPAGYSLPRLCIDVARNGLSGIEGLGGIPGTVGGALWMNAGAYGHEIGTVTETVRVARGGKVVEIPGTDVQWNYRHTSFREGELLLGATLRLIPDDPEKIRARMEDAKSRRMATQPHGSRSAGCFFKNPPEGNLGTGRIIDELGMKGSRRGSARVSPVHANFIVTEGEGARAEDALALAEEVRERVKREHGIELEYEVELWRANEPRSSTGNDDAAGELKRKE